MKKETFLIIVGLVFLIIGYPVLSQEKVSETQSKKYVVALKDGSSLQGIIVSESATEIVIATENMGTITVSRDKIKSINLLDNSNYKKGKYWFPNPDYSRYFIGPGIQLKKGEGYYQNVDLALNTVSYGLTNFFSIGGGIELYSTLSGHPVFIVMPKLGFKVAKSLWLGGGVFYVNAVEGLGDFGGAGIGYVSATVGNVNSNVSVGAGWGYFDTNWADKPVITVSGMTRVSRSIGLVTENWFLPNYSVFSYGVRFMGEKIAVDIGLINSKDIIKTFPIGLPLFLDFVLKF
jgi:hypothetical protein